MNHIVSDKTKSVGTPAEKQRDGFFHRLFSDHHVSLVKYLTRKTADPDAAQDIAQSAYQKMMSTNDPEALENSKGYLFQVASNLAVDRLRKNNSHIKYLQATKPTDDDLAVASPSPERVVEAREQLEKVQALIGQLPDKCGKAFTMSRGQHMTYQAISGELDVSVSSVEKYIMQALIYLRKNI